MRLKPTPMTEASVIFSISWLLTFIAFTAFSLNLNEGLKASSISILFLILAYVLWAVTGWWWRKKSPQMRFFMNVTVTSVVAVGALLLMSQAITVSTLSPSIKATASGYFIAIAVVFFLTSTIAAALTQFIIVRPKKDKI